MKYTILIPGSKINEEQLIALRGEDTYFKGSIKFPKGAIILVPEKEREILQKENPEMQIIGYEGEPKDYGTALLSSMGYKAEKIDNEKRGWKDDKDIDKVYELAKSKGKSTLEHWASKEINEEDRGFKISYLSNLFKFIQEKIKEDPNFVNNIHKEKDLLSIIYSWFIGGVINGKENMYNEKSLKTEGIDELLEKFSEDGFEFSEEQSEFMKEAFTREQYEKMVEQYGDIKIAQEVLTNHFIGQILFIIQQDIAKEKNVKDNSQDLDTSRVESCELIKSAVEATESVRSGEINEQVHNIKSKESEKTQSQIVNEDDIENNL